MKLSVICKTLAYIHNLLNKKHHDIQNEFIELLATV